jgi:tetratricopeptide (TPR) repeat protein
MARELSRSERRLMILAVFALFWGAFLVALGVALPLVAVVLGALVATAAVGLGAPRLYAALRPRFGRAGRRLSAGGRAADAAALGAVRAMSVRLAAIDWASRRAAARRGIGAVAARGRAADASALRGVRAGAAQAGRIDWAGHRDAVRRRAAAARSHGRAADARAVQALGAASTRARAVEWGALGAAVRSRTDPALRRGRDAAAAARQRTQALRRELAERREGPPPAEPGKADALRLNEEAATLRHVGRLQEALERGEQALALFRRLGDARGEALTLNGLGLTQTRLGDEAGALDSYEMAVALLTELGDSHGAGRVLANLGALHRVQGHDEQARAVWNDALERLEPGTPEHDRTAEQLRLAS